MIEEQVTSTVEESNAVALSESTVASPEPEVFRSDAEGSMPPINCAGEDRDIESVSNDIESENADDSTEESESDEMLNKAAETLAEASEPDEDLNEGEEKITEESRSAEAANEDSEEPSETQANPSQPSTNESSPDAKSEVEEDERCELEKQPYKFDQCTVQIAIQLLPDDGREGGRQVIVGVRSHLDAPILRATSLHELGELPPVVIGLLDELKGELPKRDLDAREAFEQKRLEKMKRKARLASTQARSELRSKKSSSPKSLSDAPAATAAVTDNRPRPDVNVPTSTQRQIGLF